MHQPNLIPIRIVSENPIVAEYTWPQFMACRPILGDRLRASGFVNISPEDVRSLPDAQIWEITHVKGPESFYLELDIDL